MPLTFFHPEYEENKTSPQAYVKEAVRRQQELNELCRRNTAPAQMRQWKKYCEKILQAKSYAVGQYIWMFQNIIPPKSTKKLLKNWRGPFMITGVHQQGRFYPNFMSHLWRTGVYHRTWKDSSIYSSEVNEKGTREKNDGNEDVSMDDNDKIDVDSDGRLSFAAEDWNDLEHNEVPKWTEPDLPRTAGTRNRNRKLTSMRYNRCGDDFLIDKIQPEEIGEELMNVGELLADEEWQNINDGENSLQKDHSVPEREIDLEQSEIEGRENINLKILEWMYNLKNKGEEAQSIQQVDVSAEKHVKTTGHTTG